MKPIDSSASFTTLRAHGAQRGARSWIAGRLRSPRVHLPSPSRPTTSGCRAPAKAEATHPQQAPATERSNDQMISLTHTHTHNPRHAPARGRQGDAVVEDHGLLAAAAGCLLGPVLAFAACRARATGAFSFQSHPIQRCLGGLLFDCSLFFFFTVMYMQIHARAHAHARTHARTRTRTHAHAHTHRKESCVWSGCSRRG